jgi:putative membrane protein
LRPFHHLSRHDLAVFRTLMAADRTLMAWVRTSLALFSFGFTLYKVLQGFIAEGHAFSAGTPQMVGLVMSCAGTFAMVLGIIEYAETARIVGQTDHVRRPRLTLWVSLLMVLVGVGLFFGIAAHIV